MGYYSDVGLALKKKDYGRMLKAARAVDKKEYDGKNYITDFILRDAEKSDTDRDGEDIVVLKWSCKWYSQFPEVKFVTDFCKSLDAFSFFELGEDGYTNEAYGKEEGAEWGVFYVDRLLGICL